MSNDIVISNIKRMKDDEYRRGDQDLFHLVTISKHGTEQTQNILVCVSNEMRANCDDIVRMIKSFTWETLLLPNQALDGRSDDYGWEYRPRANGDWPWLIFKSGWRCMICGRDTQSDPCVHCGVKQ